MEDSRSGPPMVPGDLKPPEQTLLKETDLRRCIESLQRFICDLLIENETLRQRLAAAKSLPFEAAHLGGKDDPRRKPEC